VRDLFGRPPAAGAFAFAVFHRIFTRLTRSGGFWKKHAKKIKKFFIIPRANVV